MEQCLVEGAAARASTPPSAAASAPGIRSLPTRSPAKAARKSPWWLGLSLDRQKTILSDADPAEWEAKSSSARMVIIGLLAPRLLEESMSAEWARLLPHPWTVKKFNQERRRIARAENRWKEEITGLQRKCFCRICVSRKRGNPSDYGAGMFPGYYVSMGLSYECWLEGREEDRQRMGVEEPGLADELRALEGANRRRGAKRQLIRDFA